MIAPFVAPQVWPLVGRADELELALASLRRGRGVALSGQAGVGKTRLATEVLDVLRDAGWRVVALSAGPENEAVPFATFLPLLGEETGGDAAGRFLRAAKALTARDHRVVVAIDDAHLLDEVSVAFVRHLVTATDVRLLLTIRSGELVPSTIVSLWQSDVLRRVEVLALARDETDELLTRALEVPVDARVVRWVWEAAHGNPLFIRELVLDAMDTSALVSVGGRWTLAPHAEPAGVRLREIIAARVGALTDEERAAVELVAVGEPLGIDALAAIVGVDVIARLEARALLVSRSVRRRIRVGLAHPLHREVVRSTMGAAAARARRQQLIAVIEGMGARRRDDAQRLALWRAEMGDVGDWRSLFAAASELARASRWGVIAEAAGVGVGEAGAAPRHLEQAAFLARAALDGGGSAEVAALLAKVLAALGHAEEAHRVFASMDGLATDPEAELATVRLRAEAMHFALGDPAAALAELDAFIDRTGDPCLRAAARATRAVTMIMNGSATDAITIGREVLADAATRRHDALLASIAVAMGQGEVGDPASGIDLIDRTLGTATSDDPMDVLGAMVVAKVVLLAFGPQLDEAEQLASTCRHVAAAGGDDDAVGIFDIALSNIALSRGEALVARTLAEDARHRVLDDDPFGVVRNAISTEVHAAALLGDLEGAQQACALLDAHPVRSDMFTSDEIRARAWLDVAAGRVSAASDRLHAGAGSMAASDRLVREATLLHDLVRLGNARDVAHRLRTLARESRESVVVLMARHADVAHAGDPIGLLGVSSDWDAAGFRLFAAEAAAQASAIHARARDTSAAASAAARSRALGAGCPGVITPALTLAGPAANLTRREREIASLAALGKSDREIAEALVVSVRTVNAHLYNAYSKLGVDGRAELASVLG